MDSLYVSYSGELAEGKEAELKHLKDLAQSVDSNVQATAQLKIRDHLFEVKDKGAGPYPYVLEDNWFRIQIASATSNSIPLAYCQVRSDLVSVSGPEISEVKLREVVEHFGKISGKGAVSRADLFVDFCSRYRLEDVRQVAWIRRSKSMASRWEGRRFSGWSFGKGRVAARLYDKTLEIEKSGKSRLKKVWTRSGWDGQEAVWRLEFQYRRPFLVAAKAGSISSLVKALPAIWKYGTERWLRLSVPKSEDGTSARWPTDPFWLALSDVPWKGECRSLDLSPRERLPDEERLVQLFVGALTSSMACRGTQEVDEGLANILRRAEEYAEALGHADLANWAAAKAGQKGRRFNTVDNQTSEASGHVERSKNP